MWLIFNIYLFCIFKLIVINAICLFGYLDDEIKKFSLKTGYIVKVEKITCNDIRNCIFKSKEKN